MTRLTDYIDTELGFILRKYKTRDPFKLLDAIGAVTVISDAYSRDGLKGYSMIMNRIMYAVINGKLPKNERRIVAGHEAAHLILHKRQIMSSPVQMMKDFNIYDNSGRFEREANTFLADFLVSDEDVLDVIAYDSDFFNAARELRLPAQLFAFKLYNMARRGHNVHSPVDLDSRFLGDKR